MTAEIQDALRSMAAARPKAADKRALAESTAGKFEQIFVQQMVQAMRSSVAADGEGGFFGKDAGSGTYEDWFDMHLSEHLSESGGLGIAEMMLRDWERRGWIEKRPAPGAGAADDGNGRWEVTA